MLALSNELLTNHTFDTTLSPWQAIGDATHAVIDSNGIALIPFASAIVQESATVTQTGIYQLDFDCISNAVAFWSPIAHTITNTLNSSSFTRQANNCQAHILGWSHFTHKFLLVAGNSYSVTILNTTDGNFPSPSARLDNVYLTKTLSIADIDTGLIVNGDFVGPDGWIFRDAYNQLDAGQYITYFGVARVNHAGAISQTFTIPITDDHHLSFDCLSRNSLYDIRITYSITSSGWSTPVSNSNIICNTGSWSSHLFTHTLQSGSTYTITIQRDWGNGSAGFLIDNISLIPVHSYPPFLDQISGTGCEMSNATHTQAQAGHINTYNGNMSYQETDTNVPVAGPSLNFNRSYRSHPTAVQDGAIGNGWVHNYETKLRFSSSFLSNTIELQTALGTLLPFYDNGDGTYTPYAGITAELTWDAISEQYTVTCRGQNSYTFDPDGQLLRQTDPFSNTITFTYNGNGQLIEASQGERALIYEYDATSGRLITVQDHTSRTIHLAYTDDLLTGVTNPLSLTTQYNYTGTLLTTVTNATGREQLNISYDNEGRAIQERDGAGNLLVDIDFSEPGEHIVTQQGVLMTHYYNNRHVLSKISFDCHDGTPGCQGEIVFHFDAHFQATHITDLNQQSTTLRWDGSDLTQVTNALNHSTYFTYDDAHHLIEIENGRGYTTSYGYDHPTLPSFMTRLTNSLQQTTLYTATANGFLTAVAAANGQITRYTYNLYGQLTAEIQADGTAAATETHYGYDSLGRLITTTLIAASGNQTTLYIYDGADRLIAAINNWQGDDPAEWLGDCLMTPGPRDYNSCTRYGYDLADRLISTTNTLSQTDLTFYDPAGRVITQVNNYDDLTTPASLCTDFTNPDPEYNLCTLTAYDAYGRTAAATNSLGQVTLTFYDSLGRVKGTIVNRENVTTLDNCQFPPTNADEDICTLYSYDPMGNRLTVTNALGQVNRTFYTPLNQAAGTIDHWDGNISLADCTVLPPDRDENRCTLYHYDEMGHTIITTDTLGRMTRTFYDPLDRVAVTVRNWNPTTLEDPTDCVYTVTNMTNENICTAYNYDAAGNQITVQNSLDQTTLTVYDAANRPFIQVSNWDGIPIETINECAFPPLQPDVNVYS